MSASGQDSVLQQAWKPVFRHSAGRLGSHYLTALREQGRLLGWRTRTPDRLSLPPKDFGCDGEWIEVGPGAALLSFVPSAWMAGAPEAPPHGFVLARVAVDGAPAPILALARMEDEAAARRGMRLTIRYPQAGDASFPGGFWFEPASAENPADTQ